MPRLRPHRLRRPHRRPNKRRLLQEREGRSSGRPFFLGVMEWLQQGGLRSGSFGEKVGVTCRSSKAHGGEHIRNEEPQSHLVARQLGRLSNDPLSLPEEAHGGPDAEQHSWKAETHSDRYICLKPLQPRDEIEEASDAQCYDGPLEKHGLGRCSSRHVRRWRRQFPHVTFRSGIAKAFPRASIDLQPAYFRQAEGQLNGWCEQRTTRCGTDVLPRHEDRPLEGSKNLPDADPQPRGTRPKRKYSVQSHAHAHRAGPATQRK